MPKIDLHYQLNFVLNSINRLQSIQDSESISPSFGSFCYPYWRDKVSDFSDARYQEAGATMLLLKHDKFNRFRNKFDCLDHKSLYSSFASALFFLDKIQNKDGSFDEWYKGEHGFAATEFNIIAYGLACYFLKDKIKKKEIDLLISVINKAANWLTVNNDFTKSNHQAAAGAALIISYQVTKNSKFKISAKEKIDSILKKQKKEGWFSEVGGMDLGYCSVLLDYIMLYQYFSKDRSVLIPMKKLFFFIKNFIQPDFSILKEAGLCLNPYVSRTGFLLLSKFDNRIKNFFYFLQSKEPTFKSVSAFLSDDLRLCRWSYLPIINYLLLEESSKVKKEKGCYIDFFKFGWKVFNDSKLSTYKSKNLNIFFSAAGGGVMRAFDSKKLIFEDLGYYIKFKDKKYCHNGYDRFRSIKYKKNGISFVTNFGLTRFFFPTFVSKIILRIICKSAFLSKISRSIIDFIRVKKQTALNQSSAPLSSKISGFLLSRSISINEKTIFILDKINIPFEISNSSLQINYSSNIKQKNIKNDEFLSKEFFIKKKIDLDINLLSVETSNKNIFN